MASTITYPNSWDCHVHSFDPEFHPFKDNRSYTPKSSPLLALVQNTLATHIMLVQASIEDGFQGLLDNLTYGKDQFPLHTFHGTIFADPDPRRTLQDVTTHQFDQMHKIGVRSIRIHGAYGGFGDDLDWVKSQFEAVADLYPVKKYGWTISAQLPLATWASLKDFLMEASSLGEVRIVADHNGSSQPSDIRSSEFDDFCSLMEQGRISVKIGALHRRSPADIHAMKHIVQKLVQCAPGSVVWGSDWPHVDAAASGIEPAEALEVDSTGELGTLREWLSEEDFHAMLVTNPPRVFCL